MYLKKNILIIGCGNIGFRHVQSLIKNNNINKIYIYDIDFCSYDIVRSKLKTYKNKINFIYNFNKIKIKNFFLVIFSNYAKGRYLSFKLIDQKFKVQYYLIEKIVENNLSAIEKFKKNKKIKFVNLPMRMMRPFKLINKIFSGQVIDCIYHGTKWNLLSNSLHYINFVSHITQSKIEEINIVKIGKPYKTKRPGQVDFFGKIFVKYSNGSTLFLNSVEKKITRKFDLINKNNSFRYYLDQNILKFNKKKLIIKREHISN